MFKILAGILIGLSAIGSSFSHVKVVNSPQKNAEISYPAPSKFPISIKKTLFIPSWTLGQSNDFSGYNQLIYFGITPDENGIVNDNGYQRMHTWVKSSGDEKKLLAVVMTNTDIDEKVLQNKNLSQKIISQSVQIAKENNFNGVVLDFEISALGFQSITDNITNFETLFAKNLHKNNLSFYPAIYGDTYIRARPFDIKSLGKVSDGIFILAYDLHKANGDPGPNFPLREKDDYSLKNAVSDFSKDISIQKIIITFGMFGYDWTVDNKNQSIGQADPLSLSDIKQKFFPVCEFTKCKIIRDKNSTETEITYVDSQNQNHIVWFEDMQSVMEKENYLKSIGIGSYAFWAYSYF